MWIAFALMGLAGMVGYWWSPSLRPGQPAPDFDLPGSDGQRYRLADLVGQQEIVLAWFPKAETGG